MKQIECKTISHQLAVFMIDYHEYYDEKDIAKLLDISPQTLSKRKYKGFKNIDEIRALKRLFKNHDLILKI